MSSAISSLPPLVVVDVGGTNLRIATFSESTLSNFATAYCEAGNPEAFIASYLDEHKLVEPIMCMAIACPITGDQLSMTNFNWKFSISALKERLKLSQFFVINDFHAMSLCVPSMGASDLIRIGGGVVDRSRACVVCGPGTGMGLSHLIPVSEGWTVMPGEGGHGDLAPNSEREAAIWLNLFRQNGHIAVEDILSGPGMIRLYKTLCEIEGTAAQNYTAADITSKTQNGSDAMCSLTLTTFCELLGSWCGSIAINAGAFGGVYLTGGVVPKFLEYFLASPFYQRFTAKGDYSKYAASIPVFLITSAIPGLTGAAEYLRGELINQGYSLNRTPIRKTT